MRDKNFNRLVCDCKMGVKALQNLRGSAQSIDLMRASINSESSTLLVSLFCAAVVQYAKPFSDTVLQGKKIRFPIRRLKGTQNFENGLHKHLMDLRNMFLAHDDLDALEPKFAITKMLVKPANFEIPISIAITNKRLGYPSDDATAVRLKSHIEAAVEGVQMCLISDIKEIRALALEKQGEPDPRYTSHYGSQKINGNELNVPDILGDGWMDPKAPGFGDIKNGYRYEPFSFKFDFYGPETIILPNGGKIEMQPPLSDRPGVVDYRPNNS